MIDPALAPWLAAVFGLLAGSFLNVCIARLPLDYSIVSPRSHCPHCGAFIAAYDNIPVVSWLLLGGRCRHCRARISWRYPLVEALAAFCCWLAVAQWGATWAGLRLALFAIIVIELAFTDIEARILPDEFTKGGFVLGLFLAAIEPLPQGLVALLLPASASPRLASFVGALAAALLCAGGIWLIGYLYQRLRGREGLGLGDVKMIAFFGVFLGLEATLLSLVLGSLLGAVIGMSYIYVRRKDPATYELPYGAFLGAAALLTAFLQPFLK
jgi:leader peptidase (prepilin peptidase)/N-methyltransferase